jgi:hypothetical protein
MEQNKEYAAINHLPFSAVINYEFEDTMPVRHSEDSLILSWFTFDRFKESADVRVEHGKF